VSNQQWWSKLTGYLIIEVEGEGLEPFINMAMTRGILLWEIRRTGEHSLQARVRISGFFGLRHIARRTRCRVRIRARCGLPFLAAKIRRRKVLAIGSLLFLSILYLLSSFVWVVKVTGNENLKAEEILEAAEAHGLRPGVLRSQLDKSLLEQQLREEFPGLTFVTLWVKGTMIEIEVVEKVLPPEVENEKQPAHLIASRDGIVEDIVVMVGDPQVKPGDTVKTGQILISGVVPPPGTREPPLPGVILPPPLETEYKYVHARGLVRARVWYEGYGDAYLVEEEEYDGGEKATQFRATVGDKEIILWGPRTIPFTEYRQQSATKGWLSQGGQKWGLNFPPVHLHSVTFYEVIKQRVELGREGAVQAATKRAVPQVEQLRLPDSEKVQEKIELIPVEDENQVRVRVRLETIENIGQVKLFSTYG
jgi:similar to stage IV sporulation protein